MSQGKSKPKRMQCSICGDYFEALKRCAKHCEACRYAIKLADRHAQYRIKKGKLAREDYRAYVEAEARKAAKARKSGEAANRPRCLRCGSRYSVDSSGYCLSCRRNGLDSVHKETGRTNGWDRPATVKVKAVGGWRGRPVAGRSVRGDMTVLLDDAP